MPSTAQVAQLSKFYVSGTPGASITITAITKAAAAVVTATNTLAVGDVLIFGTVTNMPEIAGLLGIVTAASGSSFTVAIDSSGFAAAGTSGTAIPQTFSKVGNVQDFTPDGGTATVIDVTNMDSLAKEKRQGLQDNGNYALTYDADDTDVGQLRLIAARAAQAVVVFKQYYPGGLKIRAWQGFVQKITEPVAGVDKVLRCSATLVVTGPIARG
ncbi:MAG: Phage tail protein [Candidatus Accumulibacter appositus]|uniref:Phage tail protein n=1 Tax=Candidatus Accumulibacter appositus TaxID=1454003 RepID=A0A011NP82_9PROT|nr:phage tail tube protein [Accumulibacter sp.]EXI77111.1 MAG: Phage tail protein [Candidatus Accumulibacter appositus]HRD90692.1 phage tail tube protein [Accumulibacter sp.]